MRNKRRKRRSWSKGWLLAALVMALSVVNTPRVPARDRVAETGAGTAQTTAGSQPAEEQVQPVLKPDEAVSKQPQTADPDRETGTDQAARQEAARQEAARQEAARQEADQGAVDQQAEPAPERETDLDPDQEAAPVPLAYFADAAFLGDSRTEGFQLYSGLTQGAYFHAVGATVKTVLEQPVYPAAGGEVPLVDAMTGDYGKIYVMLGVNELGWVYGETFAQEYGKVLDRLMADHPAARLAVASILPVSADQDAKRSYVNNRRIAEYNALLKDLAEEKGCVWLDVASAVADETGTLPPELTFDGVHLNAAGCKRWLDYLREHPL